MRYLVSILMLMAIVPSYATTMCAMNDTRAVILDADIPGTGYTNDANSMQWTTTFPYGKIYGFAACVSNAPSGSMGTTVTSAGTPLEAGGAEREGRYCWCKITHPVSSLWAFFLDYGSASRCASYCANYCGYDVQVSVALRAGLFGSVAPDAN